MSEDMLKDLEVRLGTEDAAKFLGVSVSSMATWRDEGRGPGYLKIGGTYQYPAKWLKEYLLKSVVCPEGGCPDVNGGAE